MAIRLQEADRIALAEARAGNVSEIILTRSGAMPGASGSVMILVPVLVVI